MNINKVIATGNLTREPDLRYTNNSTAVLNFGIAINDRRRNNVTGEWEDYPNFVDCKMFGSRAEKVAEKLEKGMKVAIEGKLAFQQWERDGQKRSKLEVVVEQVEFLSQRRKADEEPQQQDAMYMSDVPF